MVEGLSARLTEAYGSGFTRPNLFHMVRFAEVFPDEKIVYTLCRQLSWSHFRWLIYLDDPLRRDFYAEMCRVERWSVRTLQSKLQGMLFERTALSRKPADLARAEVQALRQSDEMSPDLVFRDPYLLASSAWPTPMPRRIWKRRSSASSSAFSWSWAPISAS